MGRSQDSDVKSKASKHSKKSKKSHHEKQEVQRQKKKKDKKKVKKQRTNQKNIKQEEQDFQILDKNWSIIGRQPTREETLQIKQFIQQTLQDKDYTQIISRIHKIFEDIGNSKNNKSKVQAIQQIFDKNRRQQKQKQNLTNNSTNSVLKSKKIQNDDNQNQNLSDNWSDIQIDEKFDQNMFFKQKNMQEQPQDKKLSQKKQKRWGLMELEKLLQQRDKDTVPQFYLFKTLQNKSIKRYKQFFHVTQQSIDQKFRMKLLVQNFIEKGYNFKFFAQINSQKQKNNTKIQYKTIVVRIITTIVRKVQSFIKIFCNQFIEPLNLSELKIIYLPLIQYKKCLSSQNVAIIEKMLKIMYGVEDSQVKKQQVLQLYNAIGQIVIKKILEKSSIYKKTIQTEWNFYQLQGQKSRSWASNTKQFKTAFIPHTKERHLINKQKKQKQKAYQKQVLLPLVERKQFNSSYKNDKWPQKLIYKLCQYYIQHKSYHGAKSRFQQEYSNHGEQFQITSLKSKMEKVIRKTVKLMQEQYQKLYGKAQNEVFLALGCSQIQYILRYQSANSIRINILQYFVDIQKPPQLLLKVKQKIMQYLNTHKPQFSKRKLQLLNMQKADNEIIELERSENDLQQKNEKNNYNNFEINSKIVEKISTKEKMQDYNYNNDNKNYCLSQNLQSSFTLSQEERQYKFDNNERLNNTNIQMFKNNKSGRQNRRYQEEQSQFQIDFDHTMYDISDMEEFQSLESQQNKLKVKQNK